ncbi:MAG: ABC transporter substrate-binding protein [bacterium]
MKNLINRRIRVLSVAGVCGAAMLHCPAYGGPVKVNVSVPDSLTGIVFHIGKEKKYFKKEGLDVRLVPWKGNRGTVFKVLAGGTMDVAACGFVANYTGLMRESGARIVAGCMGFVKGKPASRYYLVRKDLAGEIKSFADLKGRNVGTPVPGRTLHIWLLRKLDKAGLSEKDFTGKVVPDNIFPAMFAGKELDVGIMSEPLASQLVNKGLAEVFAGTDIADETSPRSMLYYSGRFMKNRQAARRFMTAYLRSVREFYRAAPEEINDIAVRIWGMPIEANVLSRLNLITDGKIDTQALMAEQEYALSRGWIKTKADEKDFIDSSYMRYANKVLRTEDRAREESGGQLSGAAPAVGQ